MDLFESEILRLREELNKHNHNYYVLNHPTISDQEYDAMMRQLQELEAEHKELFDPLSPTQRVGSDLTPGFVQVTHEKQMLSLGNTYSIQEVEDFLRRTKQTIGEDCVEIVGELKYDITLFAGLEIRCRMFAYRTNKILWQHITFVDKSANCAYPSFFRYFLWSRFNI